MYLFYYAFVCNDEAFVRITQFYINNIIKSVIGSACSRDNEKNKAFALKLIDIKIKMNFLHAQNIWSPNQME